MAEVDWERIETGAADSELISQGYSAATIFGPLSGSNVYGFHSLAPVDGAAGIVVGLTNFYPIGNSKGGRVQCCLRKYSQLEGYSLFMFMVTGKSMSAPGYLFGLSNGYPYKLILCRGAIGSGLLEEADNNLRESDAYFSTNSWKNLSLSVKVTAQGDISLIPELDTNDPIVPGAPSYTAILGMDEYIDDSLGILTGYPGLRGDFYVGLGFHCRGGSGRIGVADYMVVGRQTTP